MTTWLTFFAILMLNLSSLRVFSSPQMPDYIIFNKDTVITYNLLLEQYLQKHVTKDSVNLLGLRFSDGASLNCWRGYQAIYKLENDSLFLVNIIDCGQIRNSKDDEVIPQQRLKAIFGEKVKNKRVFIDWFSGDLNFPLNDELLRWDGVFYKIFDKETLVSITSGVVRGIVNVGNYIDDPKAINRKDKSIISNVLFKKLKTVNWKKECDCSETYLVKIDEYGKIADVRMQDYDTEEKVEQYWEKGEYKYCIETIFNALQKLRFDVIRDRGKPISEDIPIKIWITDRGRVENWTN